MLFSKNVKYKREIGLARPDISGLFGQNQKWVEYHSEFAFESRHGQMPQIRQASMDDSRIYKDK